LFADDSLLLFKIDEQGTTHLQEILSLYEDCSGQIINKDKSSIMFSKNTGEGVRESVMAALQLMLRREMRSTLGYQYTWGNIKHKILDISKKWCGSESKGGRRNYYPKRGRIFLLTR
jgi:hypothetical protein